jgi:hypothetical protein
VNTKADSSVVEGLRSDVDSNTKTLTDLTGVVNTKADSSVVEGLRSDVDSNTKTLTDLTGVVNTKADSLVVEGLRSDVDSNTKILSDLIGVVGDLRSNVEALENKELELTNNVSILQGNVSALTITTVGLRTDVDINAQTLVDITGNVTTLEGLVEGLDVGDLYANVQSLRGSLQLLDGELEANVQSIRSNIQSLSNNLNESVSAISIDFNAKVLVIRNELDEVSNLVDANYLKIVELNENTDVGVLSQKVNNLKSNVDILQGGLKVEGSNVTIDGRLTTMTIVTTDVAVVEPAYLYSFVG